MRSASLTRAIAHSIPGAPAACHLPVRRLLARIATLLSPSTAGDPAHAEDASAGWKPKNAENVRFRLYREMESQVR
jgi:hypothetical protein